MIKFEPVKGGIHAGGQHSQKNSTGVRATDVDSGIVVVIRGRSLKQSKRLAVATIKKRLKSIRENELNQKKNARRLEAIRNGEVVRTYKEGIVIDHRTGKRASYKDVVIKGRLDLLK